MIGRGIALMALMSGSMAVAQEQQIDLSVIRAAGAVCAAGFKPDTQDELDSRLAGLFGGVGGSDGSLVNSGQVGEILETLVYDPRGDAYETYAKCVMQTVGSVINVSSAAADVDSGREVIFSQLVPDPLGIMKSGDRFQMGLDDARAIERQTLLFSMYEVDRYSGSLYVGIRVSDLETGKTFSKDVYQTAQVQIGENCFLTPYIIDLEKKRASFIAVCK